MVSLTVLGETCMDGQDGHRCFLVGWGALGPVPPHPSPLPRRGEGGGGWLFDW